MVKRPNPCEHVFVTTQGSLRHQFQRALERGSVIDALALCVVLAERDPVQYPRAAARWIARFLEEAPGVALEETQLVAAALAALTRAPKLALPVLRELVRVRQLVTVQSVFEEFSVVS